MNEENQIKIIVKRGDNDKLELTTHCDSDLEEWERIIRIILKWITFGEEQVNEFFNRDEYGEDLKD